MTRPDENQLVFVEVKSFMALDIINMRPPWAELMIFDSDINSWI